MERRKVNQIATGLVVALTAVTIVTAVGVTSGCAVVTPAAPDRASIAVQVEPVPDDAWPQRYPEPIVERLNAEPDQSEDAPTGTRPVHQFLFRAFGLITTPDEMPEYTVHDGVVVVEARSTSHMVAMINRLPPERFDAVLSRRDGQQLTHRHGLYRWHFLLREPDEPPARGLVIHLTSLGDRSYESRVADTLRERGWAVLEVIPGGFVVRFTTRLDNDPTGSPGAGGAGGSGAGDAPAVKLVGAAEVARALDEFAADYTRAVEGALAHLQSRAAQVPQRPLVVVGYSAGAMAVPAVMTRLRDRTDAVVLIGGGANIAHVLVEGAASRVGRWVRSQVGARVDVELDALVEQYLTESRFDPYATAPLLADLPVLLIDGRFDLVIPQRSRDLLYDRLGRPERWTYPFGHALLFATLPMRSKRIADWIEQRVDMRGQ